METELAGEQDWRLQAELEVADPRGALRELLGRLRGGDGDVVREIEATVPHDVVITHDGKLLFAYAAEEATLAAARSAIEGVLARDGIGASVRISHWDEELEKWRQTDPPPTAAERELEVAAEHDADAIETRTLVVSSGKMIRAEFEQSIREWADKLGLECSIVEHPHLLTTQLAFTVTGPKRKLDEFAKGLAAEERATIRTETVVMSSPL
ncbi:MAG: hypothetical protein ABSG93_05515 [Solirubrobacteraceae bacterium]|jgi:hypothetical protein